MKVIKGCKVIERCDWGPGRSWGKDANIAYIHDIFIEYIFLIPYL